MALSFKLNEVSNVISQDDYSPDSSGILTFNCPGKKREVKTILSGPINVSVNSQWTKLFNAVGDIGSRLVDVADNIHQILSGGTIRQPWFGRKLWTGTEPLKFNLPIRFVSFLNAKTEVMDPMMDLLSMVHPRVNENSGSDSFGFNDYVIPGPSIFYTPGKEGGPGAKGDRVEISLGEFLHFQGCYITNVNFNIENSFNLEGLPHTVGGNVSFESMDIAFVDRQYRFMNDGFRDPAVDLSKNIETFYRDVPLDEREQRSSDLITQTNSLLNPESNNDSDGDG